MHLQTCRFCHETTLSGGFIQYALRTSACPRCFLQHKGVEGLRALPLWKLEAFPAIVAFDAGMLPDLEAVIGLKRAQVHDPPSGV